jgi:dipeptidyl aminopeptidase/acylaminoacyl peptidase
VNRKTFQVRPRGPRQPTLEAVGPFLAPGLSIIGLVLVGVISLGLINGRLPSFGGFGGPDSNDDGGPIKTPTPSDVIIIDPRSEIPGTIAYVKAGNIWIQSGDRVYRLTNSGQDAMPSWSPDGEWIYFIRYTDVSGQFVIGGDRKRYALHVPQVMRIRPDSDSQPELLMSGLVKKGDQRWSTFIRQPVLSPNLNTLALVSDGPDPLETNVVVQFFDLTTRQLTNPGLDQIRPLGHQDPEWAPDGSTLLFVKNGREGSRGAPMLMRYRLSKNKLTVLAGPGYNSPSWSRDGRFIAATRTDGLGTDVVILDATTGAELLRVTNDGQSFSGVWSPVGDALAYLHIDRGVVDLVTVKLVGSGPDWTLGETIPLTDAAGLDGASRPSWFVPANELPQPTPTPVPSVTVAPSTPVSPSP